MNPTEVADVQSNAAPVQPSAGRLEVKDVSMTYTSPTQTVVALQSINLQVRSSEFVVFFGPSGCGKSTLLNLIAGFERPTEGEVTLDGKPVEGPCHDRLMLFQEHGL